MNVVDKAVNGGQRVEIGGRAALMVRWIVAHADAINGLPMGYARFDFGMGVGGEEIAPELLGKFPKERGS